MDRFYEVMFIVRPDVEDADLDKLIAGFEQTVTNGGGTLRSTEKLGRRKLAYTVRKFNDGNYVLLTIDADGKLVAELERRLRVSEPVIKFITVRMDEEQKRIDKIKAIRATRKKVCKFCTEKIDAISYRDVRLLQGFVAERGKIVPRRLTGVCTTHQRRLTRAIKQARNIALLPFAARY